MYRYSLRESCSQFDSLPLTYLPQDVDERSHNTWIYPQRNYTAMEKRVESDATAAAPWAQPMPMFVASGSAKDVAWGRTHGAKKKTIVVLSQCPFRWVKGWAHLNHAERSRDPAYAAFKKNAKEAMMAQGFRKVFPHLEKCVCPWCLSSTRRKFL